MELNDTHPAIAALLAEGYRRMSPAAKARRVFDLSAAVQELAAARIRARHGADIPERELRLRLASLWLDRATMILVFGWDPEREGY